MGQIGAFLRVAKMTHVDPRRHPAQSGEQHLGTNSKRPGELDDGVGTRDALSALQLADRRAVEAGEIGDGLLAEVAPRPRARARLRPK